MDGNRFDDLTKRLAANSSRRSFLKRAAASVAALAGFGAAGETDAARRPTPTPKPVKCPGIQIWNGSACVCPSGTQCSSDCCQPGGVCCDAACCYGACYSGGCCPTGNLLCGDRCLPPGSCCSDAECGAGFACQNNQCVCLPTVTCASLGLNCGTATDDCGNELSCGDCTDPQTCGGGGQEGVCGCLSATTCDGHCGMLVTECGTTLDCGNPCNEACQVCQQNLCIPIDDGTDCSTDCTKAACVSGVCTDQFTVPCPPASAPSDPCVTYACIPGANGPECVPTPANDGAACDVMSPCQTGACADGQCVGTDIECPLCQTCSAGACVPITGESCGDGFQCVDGGCYSFPGGNDLISNDYANDVCAALKCETACCPGESDSVCCDSMDRCFLYGGNGTDYDAFCCAEANLCNGDCCGASESCVEGVGCNSTELICANDSFCNSACCGGDGSPGSGTCCSATQQCNSGACVEVDSRGCSSDADCLAPATCYGAIVVESPPGSFHTVQQGICCLADFYTQRNGQGICCAPGTYPSAQQSYPCCPWGSGDCPSCSCSTAGIRGWRR